MLCLCSVCILLRVLLIFGCLWFVLVCSDFLGAILNHFVSKIFGVVPIFLSRKDTKGFGYLSIVSTLDYNSLSISIRWNLAPIFSHAAHCCTLAMPRKRHEESAYHLKAVKAAETTAILEALPPCSGIRLKSADAEATPMSMYDFMPLMKLWVEAGCIAVHGSCLESICVSVVDGDADDFRVQDINCKASGTSTCMRGMGCCKSCLNAAPRANCVQHIKQWALRICFTDLTHIALTGDKVEQLSQVNFMKNMFPELKQEPLEVLPYSELVTKTRNLFMHIGVSRQNRALQSFLARSLKFLTPTMVAGLSPDVRSQVVHFVEIGRAHV